MTTILLDPTLRRARIMRVTVAALTTIAVAALALCAVELRAHDRQPPTLPSPRRPSKTSGRRPYFGRDPAAGRGLARKPPPLSASIGALQTARPTEVIAFIDPSVAGALASLRAHARDISTAAFTGLELGDDGTVIDHLDRSALRVASQMSVRATVLLQNVNARDGWRADRVRALARDRHARARLADELTRICRREGLDGVHLDLEDLGEDTRPLAVVVADVAPALRAARLQIAVDVPAAIDATVLARIGASADRVVVMAYDEHDAEAPPGSIASDGFVDDAVRGAAAAVAADKLVAGLAIYGYDWIGAESADSISFADAHAAAKEARVAPRWDPSGNVRFQFSDDDGHHQVWLTDAASVWNHMRIAAAAGVRSIALWRLGGEDPAIWDALARWNPPPRSSDVPPEPRIINEGDGPFLSLALAPEPGRRTLQLRDGRIVDEQWPASPSSYLVRRAGIVPGQVAITFDDGPDPRFTPAILDLLRREQVPASFFVIGTQAAAAPDLVRRAVAEGHEIGNHTFTHPDVDHVGELRLRTELEATSQLLESIVGRRPLMYRPPSLADVEPRTLDSAAAFARAGSLGYLVVDADVDPRDWSQPTAAELTRNVLAQSERGGVILLHDGGGDRAATVAALPAIIAGLRARGLRFVSLPALVGKSRDDVMPRSATTHMLSAHAISAHLLGAAFVAAPLLRAVMIATLALVVLRALFMLVAALVAERRRRRFRARGPLPPVTAIIPAFNEAPVIERTIDAVLASDVPVEVIVVDDGSNDGTSDRVAARYRRDPRVRLLRQANAGKAAALRAGIAVCRTEILVALDGDTLFAPTTIRRLIEPMSDPRIAAVAGTAEVGNPENALARWQSVEYLTQQEIERRAWDAIGAVPIVPGAVGAWRRRALLEAGGFSSDTLAEDADLAMALCRRGWRVVHAPAARARTEVPTTLRSLVRQRVRWSFGTLQALWKHRRAAIEPTAFGRWVWPAMLLFQVLLPLATPAALLSLLLSTAAGNLRPAFVVAVALFSVEALQLAVAAWLARRSGGSARHALAMLTSAFLYRPLLLLVTLRSIARLFDGVPLGWGKLSRRNTAVAYAASTARTVAARIARR